MSGGSIVNIIADKLTKKEIEWDKWRIFFCDERFVPFTDAESTYAQYKVSRLNKWMYNITVAATKN